MINCADTGLRLRQAELSRIDFSTATPQPQVLLLLLRLQKPVTEA
jgi:hypothetical protein